MKYTVYVSALKYGEVEVEAATWEEAQSKVAEMVARNEVVWHGGEITDMTAEERENG